jgi:hypothetical protein
MKNTSTDAKIFVSIIFFLGALLLILLPNKYDVVKPLILLIGCGIASYGIT